MIVGVGLDLVELARIERSLTRFGGHFLRRLFHEEELAAAPEAQTPPSSRLVAWTAARFAAKEAAAKALGTGFSGGVTPHDLRVLSLPSGKPELFLHGAALEAAASLGATRFHLSLTHARETAAATVILEHPEGT